MPSSHDRQLLYFVRTADRGSVSAAARSLGLTQPTLSAALSRLQRDIGVTLFHSNGRGLTLTDDGERLLVHARAAVRAMDRFHQAARARPDSDAGVVTIAAPSGVILSTLAPLLRVFMRRRPQPQVRIVHTFALDETLAALRNHAADLALVPRLTVPEDLNGFAVGVYELMLAVPRGAAIPARPVHLDDLDNVPFIGSRPGTAAARVLNSAADAGAAPRIVLVEPEIAAVGSLVAAGIGAGIVVSSMQKQLHADGVTVRSFAQRERWPVRLMHRDEPLSLTARRFIDVARAQTRG